MGGLSPRVRGNRNDYVETLIGVGSIPACAGEPLWQTTMRRRKRVYPRVCGGTPLGSRLPWYHCGLSPRVRGNRRRWSATCGSSRSIPACAGEPTQVSTRRGIRGVYPRVCGGTHTSGSMIMTTMGLSPRVRGNQGGHDRLQHVPRSIPACAGEPIFRLGAFPAGPVYPRVCGGTRRPPGQQHRPVGSIPACAGEPITPRDATTTDTVYPRVCGGTSAKSLTAPAGRGLSPRVRGNPIRAISDYRRRGSIPACAGEPGE